MTKFFLKYPLFYDYGFLLLYMTTVDHVKNSRYTYKYSENLFLFPLGR